MYGLKIGSFVGQYRIDQPLGSGGMATVFQGYHPALDRMVAIKIMPPVYASDPDFIARFTQEARTVARLSHPHILDVFDFGEQDGVPYMVMEYISGGTLHDRFSSRIPFEFTARVIELIAAGLDYAHQRGILHRDIKPRNILMRADDTPVIADFGIAKIVESGAGLTRAGTILGTPEYMSPEQALSHAVDARSDVYSLGVILYQMLVGRVPFTSESALTTIMAHVQDPLPPPHSINPAIPEPIERILFKVLAKTPDDRFQSAGELSAALNEAIAGIRSPAQETGLRLDRRHDDTRLGIAAPNFEPPEPAWSDLPSSTSVVPPPPLEHAGSGPAAAAAPSPPVAFPPEPVRQRQGRLPRWLIPAMGALLVVALLGALAVAGPWRAAAPAIPTATLAAPTIPAIVTPPPGATLTRVGPTDVPVGPMGGSASTQAIR